MLVTEICWLPGLHIRKDEALMKVHTGQQLDNNSSFGLEHHVR